MRTPRQAGFAGLAAVLVAGLAVAGQAHAGPKGKAKPQDIAVTLYQEAVNLAQEGKYEPAIALFEKALDAGAPSLALYNIARCHESLGDLEAAVLRYKEYIESPDATDVEQIQATIDTLTATPSEVTFTTDPPGAQVAEVLEDGTDEPLGKTPLTVTASAGAHGYVLDLEGYKKRKINVEAGLGKKREVTLVLEPAPVQDAGEKDKAPPAEPLGIYLEAGGGFALHLATDIVKPAGEASLGFGYRLANRATPGFAVGFRLGIRPFGLDAVLSTGQKETFSSIISTVLFVAFYQFELHDRLGLELCLPVGLAFLTPTHTISSAATVDLLGGTIEGKGLVLVDVGVGASLRIMIVGGLYAVVEPVRLQLFVPTSKWLGDSRLLASLDFSVRLGWEF